MKNKRIVITEKYLPKTLIQQTSKDALEFTYYVCKYRGFPIERTETIVGQVVKEYNYRLYAKRFNTKEQQTKGDNFLAQLITLTTPENEDFEQMVNSVKQHIFFKTLNG